MELRKIKSFIKTISYFTIYYSGFLYLSMKILGLINQHHQIIILLYHRIHNSNEHSLLPSLHIKEFEKQINHVRKCYEIISMDELVNIRNERGKRGISAIVTFDDGI